MLNGIWSDTSTALQTPPWIEADITPYDLAEIQRNELESTDFWGSKIQPMAQETMSEHGTDILNFIMDRYGKLPDLPKNITWRDMASFYLQHAVRKWAEETHYIL